MFSSQLRAMKGIRSQNDGSSIDLHVNAVVIVSDDFRILSLYLSEAWREAQHPYPFASSARVEFWAGHYVCILVSYNVTSFIAIFSYSKVVQTIV